MILAMLAATIPLLPPDLAVDLRCVAVLGVAADPALARDGALFTAIVGAAAMDVTGQTREAVGALITTQVKIVRSVPASRDERQVCATRMRERIALQKATP